MEREYTGDWGDESLKLQGKTDIQNERAEGKTEYGEGPSLIRLFPTLTVARNVFFWMLDVI